MTTISDDALDAQVDRLVSLAQEDPAAFDGQVARYVLRPGNLTDAYRHPDVVEYTGEALDRLDAKATATVDKLRQNGGDAYPTLAFRGKVRAERHQVRPLAGHERQIRLEDERRHSPASRAAKRMKNERCPHCNEPLAPLFLRLKREEQDKDATRT